VTWTFDGTAPTFDRGASGGFTFDGAGGSGSSASGSGAITDPSDAVVGSGVAVISGAGAGSITDPPDTVAGTGALLPLVIANPSNLTTGAGGMATFIASAIGSPAPTVQWQLSTNSGSTWSNISGATNTSYTTATLTTANNGYQYLAVFTNSAGSATTSAATLAVYAAPAWAGADGISDSGVGSTYAMISWSPATAGSPVAYYELQVTPMGGSAIPVNTGSSATSFGLSGLAPNTPYVVQVGAYDAEGNFSGYQAATASFTTSATIITGTSGGRMSQYQFGAGVLFGTPLTNAQGQAVQASPVQFGALQDVSLDISFDTKMLYGSNQFPLAVGRGKGKISGKAAFAQMNGSLLNNLLFGQTLNPNVINDYYDTTGTAIPGTPYTITPVTSYASLLSGGTTPTFVADLGVRNSSGVPLTVVASGPTTGQYSVSGGVYTFAAADTGTTVFISFQYTATSATARQSTVQNVLMGYAPSFACDLYMPYNGKQLIVHLFNCLSTKLTIATKLDDFTIPSFDFEAFANGAGQVMTYSTSDN
jgi:hypothetical protein